MIEAGRLARPVHAVGRHTNMIDAELSARLAKILEASTDFVGMADAQGRTLYVNPAGRELLGIPLGEPLEGESLRRFHSPEAADLVERSALPAAIRGGVHSLRNTMRHRDGHDIPVSQLVLAHCDENGAPIWFSTVARDISRETRAEAELRKSQERFRVLIENLHVGVVVQDRNATIQLSNGKALELLGLSLEQLLGSSSFDPTWNVIHEDGTDFPGATHPVPRVLETGKPVRNVIMGVFRPTKRDRVWLLVNAEPEVDADGSVSQVVCTFSDITDRKQLEETLLQAQKLEAVGRLAGGVAHDFNNLLTVILGYIDLGVQSPALAAHEREELGLARDACMRAVSLTRQLLAFARRDIIRPTVVDVGDALREAGSMIRRLIGEHIAVESQVGRDTWPIRVDPGQLQQVIMNLAINARDAMPGGGTLRLEAANVVLSDDYTRAHAEVTPGEYVVLSVSDTGHGIPKELQPHVFEPFFTTKGTGEGTGLGLATVHGIVHHHGGHIGLHTAPGLGTTFKVYFPRCDTERAAQPAPPANPAPSGSEGATILLVEDEHLVRGFATRVLERAGYRVHDFGDPRQALEFARQHPGSIELLLTDVVMPHLNGHELAREVQALRPQTKVLYASGYTENTIVHHGVLDAGIAFLAKPYAPADLTRRVSDVLQARTGEMAPLR
jgi:two-component system cell cycle sensor histidine kinase/response regulator CckA